MKKGQESEGACGTAVLSFVLQQAVSTVGALLLGVVAVLILATLIAFFTRTPDGNLVDKVVAEPLFKIGADNPCRSYSDGFHSRVGRTSLRVSWRCVDVGLADSGPRLERDDLEISQPLPRREDVRANFFTSNCGDSDCIL
jgi:hypothetical protein